MEITSLDPSLSTQSAYAASAMQPPPGGSPQQMLQSLAANLGVSTSDLQAARTSGESLSQFATSKGISQDDLLSAVEQSITANAPAGTPALSSDQLGSMATDMVNRTPGSGGGHHHHHGGGASGVQMPDSSLLSMLQGTSSPDGTSGDTTLAQLLQQLTSGQDTSSSSAASGTSLQQLLEQLTSSSASSYGSDGSTPDPSGSIGLNAFA